MLHRILIILFPRDIRSLSAGLNYPPSAAVRASRNHPANEFADAFLTAQSVASKRSRFNEAWRLVEFWRDRIIEPMAIIEKVLDPIIEGALKKKGEKKVGTIGDNLEGETLLTHLVNLTDGELWFRISFIRTSHSNRSQDYPRRDIQHYDCRKGYCAFELSLILVPQR
jgi:hypothetical protein